MTLYNRLFGRAPSDVKETKEDFLTEALGHLLSCLPPPQHRGFIEDVLLKGVSNSSWRDEFIVGLQGADLQWKTQHTIFRLGELFHGKRPDMVLFANGAPVLVVEAKVDAPAYPEQLEAYANWLKSPNGSPDSRTAVVLLLRDQAKVPHCVTPSNLAEPGLQHMAHLRWSDVYQWLLEATTGAGRGDDRLELWVGLGQELAEFMAEIEVVSRSAVSDPANLDDVQAAQRFFNVRARFIPVIHAANKAVQDVCSSPVSNQVPTRPALNEKRNLIWSYLYVTAPPATKLYAGWGFYFSTLGDPWSSLVQLQDQGSYFFLSIESDLDIRRSINSVKKTPLLHGWKEWTGKGLVKFFPLKAETLQGTDLSSRMADWTAASLKEIWPTVQELAVPFSKTK